MHEAWSVPARDMKLNYGDRNSGNQGQNLKWSQMVPPQGTNSDHVASLRASCGFPIWEKGLKTIILEEKC